MECCAQQGGQSDLENKQSGGQGGDENPEPKQQKRRVGMSMQAITQYLEHGTVPEGVGNWYAARASSSYRVIDGSLYRANKAGDAAKVLISGAEKAEAHRLARSAHLAGHYGVNKTDDTLRKIGKVFWVGMYEDVQECVRSCEECQKRSSACLKESAPLRTIQLPKHAMRLIGVDVRKMPLSKEGYRYLVVAVDYHSKFTFARPMRTKGAAEISAFL